MEVEITWKKSILISGVGLIISFILFLLVQIIWGDVLKDLFEGGNKLTSYTTINIIVYAGIFSILGISLLVSLIMFQELDFYTKLVANLLTIVITVIILFIISGIGMIVLFSNQSTIQILFYILFWFALFSAYMLPNPVVFWYLAIIIYFSVLVFMNKLFVIQKFNLKKLKKKRKKQKPFYQSKVIR